jgi:predicted alpha/beta superfamily hydrolase
VPWLPVALTPLDRWKALAPSEATLRTVGHTIEPPWTTREAGFGWEHEIRVALPASYPTSSRSYPVLWITDGNLEPALAVLGVAELILVSVGAGTATMEDADARRTFELTPTSDLYFDGLLGERLRQEAPGIFPLRHRPDSAGGAARFLDFLVDTIRPRIASRYRCDPADHGLLGHSYGGTFVAYSLFARPGAFRRYIAGSPLLYTGNSGVFDLEERYARENDDLPASVFFGAGGSEITEKYISAYGCVSSMIRMVETLTAREYPSLQLAMSIFADDTHQNALHPAISRGVRSVWGTTAYPELFGD